MASGQTRDRITCPHCQGSLKAPPLPPGSICTCPKCGQTFPIGGGAHPAPAAPAPVPAPAPKLAPATGAATPKPASAAPAPQVQPKPKPKEKPPVRLPADDAPVRAEFADPRPAPAAPATLPPTPIVTVSDDDVIGQMLVGDSSAAAAAGAGQPAPAPVVPVRAASPSAAPMTPAPTAAVPAPTSAPRPATAPAAPKPTSRPSASPVPTGADPDQDRQLQALLSAPTKASATTAPARDAHLATMTTQPAHQQAPPPPKPPPPPRPKPPEIPVVCRLCGTRMYAKPAQVGTQMRCPDCHTENEVVAPKVPVIKTPAPVSLDEGAGFAMSEPVERPAYRPVVEPRGEYGALAQLDTKASPNRPAERPQPRAVSTDMTMTVGSATRAEEDEEEEIVVSAPVDRIDYKQVVPLPPPDDLDEDNQYRGRFRDDEWGFAANAGEKEAWKKSPFYYGILGFLFYPQTLYRFILYSVVVSIDVAMLLGAVYCAQQGETPLLLGALFLTVSGSVLSALTVGGAAPCLAAITQDTANGHDAVENWPDWNIAEWLLQALLIPAAAFLASLPGSLVASGCFAVGGAALLFAPFPILFSELLFFPIIFGSMLAEGSFVPISGALLGSMQRRGDGWIVFYGASILLGLVLAAALCVVEVGIQAGTIIVAPIAAVLWVAAIILYFRLLGRLLWYVQNYRRQKDRPE